MLAGLAALVLGLGPAPSDPGWLGWDVPDACPGAEYMESATAERLGRTPTPDDAAVTVKIVDRGADGLALTLQTDRDGQSDAHSMTAHDCRALADAAALIVALTIDPVAVAEHVETPAEPEPAPVLVGPAEPEPEPEPEPIAAEPEPEPRPIAISPPADAGIDSDPFDPRPTDIMLSAGGGLELGALPGLSGGPNIAFAVGWRRLRVEAAGWYAAPRTAGDESARVAVQVGAASARACGRLQTARVEVPLCGGLEVGGMRGSGSDTPDARAASGVWFAPTVGAGVHGWLTPRLALLGRVEVAVPVAFPAFEIRDPGEAVELFRPEPVSGRIWIGIEGKLWTRRDGSGGRRRTTP